MMGFPRTLPIEATTARAMTLGDIADSIADLDAQMAAKGMRAGKHEATSRIEIDANGCRLWLFADGLGVSGCAYFDGSKPADLFARARAGLKEATE